jgi:hypothetical protein
MQDQELPSNHTCTGCEVHPVTSKQTYDLQMLSAKVTATMVMLGFPRVQVDAYEISEDPEFSTILQESGTSTL